MGVDKKRVDELEADIMKVNGVRINLIHSVGFYRQSIAIDEVATNSLGRKYRFVGKTQQMICTVEHI